MRYENAYMSGLAPYETVPTGIPIAVRRFTYDLERPAYEIFFIRAPTLYSNILYLI